MIDTSGRADGCSIVQAVRDLYGRLLTLWDAIDIIPLGLGGADDPSNGQVLCESCHDRKTNHSAPSTNGSDKRMIAKSKRVSKKFVLRKRQPHHDTAAVEVEQHQPRRRWPYRQITIDVVPEEVIGSFVHHSNSSCFAFGFSASINKSGCA